MSSSTYHTDFPSSISAARRTTSYTRHMMHRTSSISDAVTTFQPPSHRRSMMMAQELCGVVSTDDIYFLETRDVRALYLSSKHHERCDECARAMRPERAIAVVSGSVSGHLKLNRTLLGFAMQYAMEMLVVVHAANDPWWDIH
ncbi:hypothetical protein PMIN03_011307 [Paraphaeosphaeria minitans]